MAFVHHVHLPAGLHRRETGAFDQFADVVHPRVGGGIDLDHIQGIAGGDGGAELTATAGFGGGAVAGHTVERAGQDAGTGGFARASGAAEKIGRSDAAGLQGIGEGGRDRFLADELRESLGTVFVVEGLVDLGHGAILAHGPGGDGEGGPLSTNGSRVAGETGKRWACNRLISVILASREKRAIDIHRDSGSQSALPDRVYP